MESNLTLDEVKEKLERLDEITLLELLNIHSDDLVSRFEDLIEDNLERLIREIE